MAGCGSSGDRVLDTVTAPPTAVPAPKISSVESYKSILLNIFACFYRINEDWFIQFFRHQHLLLHHPLQFCRFWCCLVISARLFYCRFAYLELLRELLPSNEDGTVREKKRSSPEDYETDEYEYDDAGNLLQDRYSHSSDGKTFRLFETRTYVYDSENRLTRQTKTDALGNIVTVELLEYNEKGNIVSDTEYSSEEIKDDNIAARKVYEYTDGGMLNSLTEYVGEAATQTFYEYNAAGKTTITTVLKSSEGRPPKKTVTSVEYDSRQNPVLETIRYPDGTQTILSHCSYEYYDDGKILNKINYVI